MQAIWPRRSNGTNLIYYVTDANWSLWQTARRLVLHRPNADPHLKTHGILLDFCYGTSLTPLYMKPCHILIRIHACVPRSPGWLVVPEPTLISGTGTDGQRLLPFITWVGSSKMYFMRLPRGNCGRVLVIPSDGQLTYAAFCLLSLLFTFLIYQFCFLGLLSPKQHLYPNICLRLILAKPNVRYSFKTHFKCTR